MAAATPSSLRQALRAAREAGAHAQALVLATQWVAQQPDDAEARLWHAHCLLEAQQPAAAAQALRAAVQRWPAQPPLWFSLALALEDIGEHAQAAAALQQLLALQPEHQQAWVNLGLLRQALGDVDGALRAHAQALRLRPAEFGRIAMALSSQRGGEVWLNSAALQAELQRLGQLSPADAAA